MTKKYSICVYCGSRPNVSPCFIDAARQVGTRLGKNNIRLVYGGGNTGLMGEAANAALAAGGEVYGVIPQSLMKTEHGHQGITELVVVDTMHQRKQAMAQASDAFLALPGSIGTFEEFFEAWTWRYLAYHDNPIALLMNTNGYYDGLLQFIRTSVAEKFMGPEQMSYLTVESEVGPMMNRLKQLMQETSKPDNFHAI